MHKYGNITYQWKHTFILRWCIISNYNNIPIFVVLTFWNYHPLIWLPWWCHTKKWQTFNSKMFLENFMGKTYSVKTFNSRYRVKSTLVKQRCLIYTLNNRSQVSFCSTDSTRCKIPGLHFRHGLSFADLRFQIFRVDYFKMGQKISRELNIADL